MGTSESEIVGQDSPGLPLLEYGRLGGPPRKTVLLLDFMMNCRSDPKKVCHSGPLIVVMSQKGSSIISAEAILKSRTGKHLDRGDVPITARNVIEFTPSEETVTEASRRLASLGFHVVSTGVTLTLEGEQSVFEEVFRVNLTLEKDEPTGNLIVRPDREATIPDSLKDFVENVVFPEPPEFFF